MKAIRTLSTALAPPRCAACRGPCAAQAVICGRCRRRLDALEPIPSSPGPQGVDGAWSAAAHEGAARDLVAALKFGCLLPAATAMAERVGALAPPALLSGALVPIPTSRLRTALRGFDPAVELAAAIAASTGLPLAPVLVRRGGGRQVGRRRGARLGSPPRIEAASPAPPSAILVDDVSTTGATVSAAAAALRRAGSRRVVAVSFCRRL